MVIEKPPYALFNNDLTNDIPPCFIASAEFDPLLDDSLALFRTLDANNISCEYKCTQELCMLSYITLA